MAYEYKTYGRTYRIDLGHDGLLYNHELGISAPDLETVKTLTREQAKKEEKAPRIPILTTGSYNVYNDRRYYEGTTSQVKDRHGYRWVTWKDENGKSQRKKLNGGVFADTPENRETLDQIVALNVEIARLYREARTLEQKLTGIED
jgi:hypothetical protein